MKLIGLVSLIGSVCIATALADPTTAVMARGGSSPLFIWDATALLAKAQATGNKQVSLFDIEAQALSAAASKIDKKTAVTATVNVIYAKTADVNPAYGNATMESMEKLLTITCKGSCIHDPLAAAKLIAAGKKAADVAIAVTGELPPSK